MSRPNEEARKELYDAGIVMRRKVMVGQPFYYPE